MKLFLTTKIRRISTLILALFVMHSTMVSAATKIIIGLDADMSSGSAKSGEAIRRGALLAINEINSRGGVLGKKLKLLVRDHRGNPARGIDNILEFSQTGNLVAVIGGLHTPVAMAELKTIHEHQIVYLSPWAAGTPVIDNGYQPNYAFRVSVRDEYAGEFLLNQVIKRGYRRPVLLLEQTGWGRSNHKSINQALKSRNLAAAPAMWFSWGVRDLSEQIENARSAGADVILLVANAPEGIVAVRSMASFPKEKRVPIFSHWGITGGKFFVNTSNYLNDVELFFLQTFSFLNPPFPKRSARVARGYQRLFPDTQSAEGIFSPAGTAHTYDLVHLLRLAIEKAGSIDRPSVRSALEQLGHYPGLIRDYRQPFTADRHDALNQSDFSLARYNSEGVIVPVKK